MGGINVAVKKNSFSMNMMMPHNTLNTQYSFSFINLFYISSEIANLNAVIVNHLNKCLVF